MAGTATRFEVAFFPTLTRNQQLTKRENGHVRDVPLTKVSLVDFRIDITICKSMYKQAKGILSPYFRHEIVQPLGFGAI